MGQMMQSPKKEAEDFHLGAAIIEQPPKPFSEQWSWLGVQAQ